MAELTVNEMLEMQRALQDKYKDKWEPICPEIGQNKLLWMIGEIGEVADIIKNAGTNLVGVKVINLGGFLMFGGTLTPELETELVAWVEEMVAGCK